MGSAGGGDRGAGEHATPGTSVASGTPSSRRYPPPLLALLAFVAGTGLIWFVLAQGNGLWLPPALQPVGHALYRGVYWLTLPAQQGVQLFLPPTHHHVPARAAPLVAVLTALGVGGLLWPFLARWVRVPRRSLWIVLPLMGVGTWAVWVEPARLAVRRYTVAISGLPDWAEGLRLVQLSDTHYGPYIPLYHLRRAVRRANGLEADLVVLTGDYVHRTPAAIEQGVGVLGELRARRGVFAVLGNHDHWEDAEAIRRVLREGGIRVLDWDRVFLGAEGLSVEPQGQSLCLAGFGDLWEDPRPPATALHGVPPQVPRIVLSHNPDQAEQVPSGLRVDLMLAGHTHGGQVRLPGWGTPLVPSRYGQKYAGGRCPGPGFPVVVSRGVGMAYLPLRWGVRPELVEVTLTGAE